MNKSKLERIKLLCEREGLICNEVDGVITIQEKKELPKSWDDLGVINGYKVRKDTEIEFCKGATMIYYNRDIFATESQAKASIALAQLSQLREVYRDGWEPDWGDNSDKWSIIYVNKIRVRDIYNAKYYLSFQSKKTAELFLNNFKDLIEEAAPLLFGE